MFDASLSVTVLFRLLLTLVLLFGLGGHGLAMAQGTGLSAAGMAAHAHAMHHSQPDCEGARQCSAPAHPAPCCVAGHCLVGVMAGAVAGLPPIQPALPVAADRLAGAAAPQGAPERPPRLA